MNFLVGIGNGFAKGLAAQLLFQPELKLCGLHTLVLRIEVGREEQGLNSPVHGVQKGDPAPDKGQAKDGKALLDQLELFGAHFKSPIGTADDNGLLLGATHQNALDQCLSANGSTEDGLFPLI